MIYSENKEPVIIKFSNKEIKIYYDYEHDKQLYKVKKVVCGKIEEEEIFSSTNYTDDIISNQEIKDGFEAVISKLFRDVEFRNFLVEKKNIIPSNEVLEDRFLTQLYYIIYEICLKQIRNDIFFKFGYKEIYVELLYQKFKLSEKKYYSSEENKSMYSYRNLFKEMYLNSYTELLEYAELYHNDISNAEEKIREVFMDDKNNCIKKDFYQNTRIKKVKNYIDKWFLMKSDYKTVDKLLKGLNSNGIIKNGIFSKIIDFLFSIKINIIVVLLPIIIFTSNYLFKYKYFKYKQYMEMMNYSFIIIVVYYVLLLIYNYCTFVWPNKNIDIVYVLTRRYYPRLLGGIIAGYAILLVGDEVYKYVLNLDIVRIILILILSWILVFVYLFSKISNTVQDKRESFIRTMRVFFTGLCHSYLLIYIFNIFIVSVFLINLDGIEINSKFLLYQKIIFLNDTIHHAKITIVYPTIAMTIGIFLQLLWEDTEITRPL